MSNDVFDAQILAEKLSKLNNSQQSIESLSRWCIFHRKKARHIVEIWDKLFNSSQREQRVSFLYLANDILQNSRRKGNEFVNEFWKVLPGALKQVYESGDENGKKAVTRLVDIWEERKVFGSRGQGLKDEMLGKNPPPVLVNNGKNSNLVRVLKKDAHSVRFKLAIGSLPEKILSAFQSVIDEYSNEEAAIDKCGTAVSNLGMIKGEIDSSSTQGNQQISAFLDELQAQETVLQQCVGKLENAEATRVMLISLLKEALQDQELKLDLVRTQLQVARGQIEQSINLRNRLASPVSVSSTTTATSMTEPSKVVQLNTPSIQPASTPPPSSLSQPMASFAPMKTSDEENKKATAAAVAAKLAASTSSAQMLTSVLSSLVAEEAASMNGGLKSIGFTSGLAMFSPEKRQKLEKPLSASDTTSSDVTNTAYFTSLQQQGATVPHVVPSAGMQSMSQSNQIQTSFGALPPLPPPPPISAANPASNQYVQSAGMMMGMMPYGYGANALPPPPPLPPHIAMGLSRPAAQPPQQSQPQQAQQQQQQQQQQQTPASGGYYRPPGIGFFGQNHQPATPPVPRQ